jgi:plastocyanin
MTRRALAVAVIVAAGAADFLAPAAPAAAGGTIKGHVRLTGKLPGNPVIRMGMDPKCVQMNAGKMTVQETVMAALDGSLANVFVSIEGSFPQTPVPADPVVIDQRGCVYRPRVVGVRAGQPLQIRNSDDLMHNVHSSSARGNDFNVSEPKAGMVQSFTLKNDERMFHLRCDIHSWMTAYVGIVNHPYFAVTDPAGTFEIRNVPPGDYALGIWHERYGPLKQTVRVRAGAIATADFSYAGNEKPGGAGIRDVVVSPLSLVLFSR